MKRFSAVILIFGLVVSGFIVQSTQAGEGFSESSVVLRTKGGTYRNSTVDKVGSDIDSQGYVDVEFTDNAGVAHSAKVLFDSSTRTKLEEAKAAGKEIDIKVNRRGVITGASN